MKLRIRRSGRHRAEPSPAPLIAALQAELDSDGDKQRLRALLEGRCQGVTYRGKPCTLDAGPDGYCVFHKPGAAA